MTGGKSVVPSGDKVIDLGHGHKMIISDYRKYKIEDVPKMQRFTQELADKGLKDPWARNHVWKFINPVNKNFTKKWYHLWQYPGFPRGATAALVVMGIYITCDQAFGSRSWTTGKSDHGHGHGHH